MKKDPNKFPKFQYRKKGWPRWATRIYNAECGRRMFSCEDDSYPDKFLVFCAGSSRRAHSKNSYTLIMERRK